MLHAPLFSIEEPKGERKLKFSNEPYVLGTVLGHFTKITSIPSQKAFEVDIFTAIKVEVVWRIVQDHGFGPETDLEPNPSS